MMSGDVGLIIECVVLSYGMSMCCCGLVLLVRIGHTNFVMCDLCVISACSVFPTLQWCS